MEMSYQHELPITPQKAWSALHNIELLQILLPGCESISPNGENAYDVVMSSSIGPIKAKFKAKLRLADLHEPHSYTMHVDANAGPLGHGRGEIKIRLDAMSGRGTLLKGDVSAVVGGKMAQLGSRLVQVAASGVANQFFGNLQRHFQADVVTINEPASPDTRPEQSRMSIWTWIKGIFGRR